jgi:hypothetical protein
MIPCSADIKQAAKKVEEKAKAIIPFTIGQMKAGGEFVEFTPEQVIPLVVDAFGLREVSKLQPISLAQSIDGANLSKHLSHVTYGITVKDKAAMCPITGRPLFANTEKALGQSRNYCFPPKIAMCGALMGQLGK